MSLFLGLYSVIQGLFSVHIEKHYLEYFWVIALKMGSIFPPTILTNRATYEFQTILWVLHKNKARVTLSFQSMLRFNSLENDCVPQSKICFVASFIPFYFFCSFFNSQERISSKEKPCLQPPNQYVFVSNQKGLTYPFKKSVAKLDQLCISNSQWTLCCCNTYILTIGESATYVVTIIRPAALFREIA